jgi:hypothetical protein
MKTWIDEEIWGSEFADLRRKKRFKTLAVTTEGLPLGLSTIKFWKRKKFKGCNA